MATTTGAPAGTLNGALDELRETVRGEVNAPDARPVFNAMHTGQPAVTISLYRHRGRHPGRQLRARERAARRRARRRPLDRRPVDDRRRRADRPRPDVRASCVDPERRRVHVQGGAVLGDVDRETLRFGLVAPERRRLRHRRRGPHARRRLRLAAAQVRARLRQPRRGTGRLRGRRGADGVGRLEPRPVLGAARRRRQLRRRHARSLSSCTSSGRTSRSRRRSTRSRRSPTSCASGASTSSRRRTRSPRYASRSRSRRTRRCPRPCTTARSRSSAASTPATSRRA